MSDRRPPNILFLMSDEHRPDVVGFEGNGVIRTPVLDELARTGVVFRNAYTPAPICVPGRQAMMAGQFPSTCGCEGWVDLQPGHMTFARRFSEHAYHTWCFGKLHHFGPDIMQGWISRPVGDVHVSPRNFSGRNEEAFARWAPSGPSPKWSDAKEIARAGIGGDGPYHRDDAMAVQGACHAIERQFVDPFYDRAFPNEPVLMKVSLLQPHYPYFTDHERFCYYLNRVEPYVDEPVFDHPFLSQHEVNPGRDASVRDLRRATAAYYGMIDQVDAHCGTVLDALRHAGQDLDDWIIIYTSDHGEMLGEHGIWEKQKFFEGSARVPLIIRWPRRFEPRVVTQNVNLCDLFATLCEFAGIALPQTDPPLDSRSLVGLMGGDAERWQREHHDETVSQFFRGGVGNLMVKRGALKYHSYGPDMPEVLFDLEADPTERRNLIDEERYSEALETFRARRRELGF